MITGRTYLDPGDRLSGYYDPPRLCRILTQWAQHGGLRNVAVEYSDNGSRAVMPFTRRLRRPPDTTGEPVIKTTHEDEAANAPRNYTTAGSAASPPDSAANSPTTPPATPTPTGTATSPAQGSPSTAPNWHSSTPSPHSPPTFCPARWPIPRGLTRRVAPWPEEKGVQDRRC